MNVNAAVKSALEFMDRNMKVLLASAGIFLLLVFFMVLFFMPPGLQYRTGPTHSLQPSGACRGEGNSMPVLSPLCGKEHSHRVLPPVEKCLYCHNHIIAGPSGD